MQAPAALRRAGTRPPPLPARLLRLASDERLVEQVRAGSEAAFEVVYDRHHRGVLAFCRHMLGSAEEAEDAVQHTFLAAYRDLCGSDKPIALRAWLYAIARNRCLTVLRARRERPIEDAREPSTEHLGAEVARRDDLRALLRDLAALPDDQRAALVLAELGDVSHEDIAQILGCAREKVKALVFQARSSLNASREARETSCAEIREQLATLRGGALRRTTLRRHVRECPGCREFKSQMDAQRKALALIIPVAPSVGLKHSVLAAVFGGGGGATAAAGGAAGGAAAGGLLSGGGALTTKALVVVALAGGGAAAVGVTAARHHGAAEQAARSSAPVQAVAAGDSARAVAPVSTPAAGTTPAAAPRAAEGRDRTAAAAPGATGRHRGRAHHAGGHSKRARPHTDRGVHRALGRSSTPPGTRSHGTGGARGKHVGRTKTQRTHHTPRMHRVHAKPHPKPRPTPQPRPAPRRPPPPPTSPAPPVVQLPAIPTAVPTAVPTVPSTSGGGGGKSKAH